MTETQEKWIRVVIGALVTSMVLTWGWLLSVALWNVIVFTEGGSMLGLLVVWAFSLVYCGVVAWLLYRVIP